jgi:hypothetical protein
LKRHDNPEQSCNPRPDPGAQSPHPLEDQAVVVAGAGEQGVDATGTATGSSSRVRNQTRRGIEIPTPTQRFVEKKTFFDVVVFVSLC